MVAISNSKSKGLSLIELMVVVAIIGISLTFGIPLYTTSVNKVHVSQVVNKLGTFKLEVVDTHTSTATWPTTLNGSAPNATVASSFDNTVNFRYATLGNNAWWGYQLAPAYGSGWIFMLVVGSDDGSYTTHCGVLHDGCTLGSCDSSAYLPAGCNETNLSDTYSLPD